MSPERAQRFRLIFAVFCGVVFVLNSVWVTRSGRWLSLQTVQALLFLFLGLAHATLWWTQRRDARRTPSDDGDAG